MQATKMLKPTSTGKSIAREPIAIVGIGCRFPGDANDPGSLWQILCDGVDAISEVPESRWNLREYYHPAPGIPGKTYSKWGGFVKNIEAFDPESLGISPREAIQMDPQQRMLLEVSWEALEDANIPVTSIAGTKTGVFVGISTHDYGSLSRADSTRVDGYSATGGAVSIAANRISYWLNASGPSVAVDTACSSALVATHLACQSIWTEESDLAVAAGVNAIFSPAPYIAFCAAGMLSPVGRCKAFDASADGFVRAEGAGIVILKPLSKALEDGNPVYAVVAGTGVNQDGRTSGIALPSQKAQEVLVHAVCQQAGISPLHVDYVEAHGTGTAAGDPIEATSLGRVLSMRRKTDDFCLIGSVKTNIGHLEAGAGIAGLIKAALMLRHRKIPPNLHFKEPNPNIPFEELRLRVPTSMEEWPQNTRVGTVGINSFGFGGTNAHVLLTGIETNGRGVRPAGWPAAPWLLPVSATSEESLHQLAQSYRAFVGGNGKPPETALEDICYTASVGRSHHEHRLALVVDSHAQLTEQLEAYRHGEVRRGVSVGRSRTGQAPRTAFVFSGQGPQWWGMGRQLWKCEPVFRDVLEHCDTLLATYADWSLLEELSKEEESSRIQETAIAQPALFALQVGLLELWRSWGVEPEAVIGHSVGEVAAAYAAGALKLEEAVKVIFYRGYSMDTASSRGRMLAVGLTPEKAAAELRGFEDRVSLAAVNGPSSAAFSGDREVLESVAGSLESRGIFCRFLQVHYAFHSPQMEPVREALLAALEGIDAHRTTLPMISAVTGSAVAGPELAGEYWWQNVRQTVQFAAGVERLLEDGYDTFVELSPHPVLSGSIHEVLADKKATAQVLPSLRRQEDERAQMLSSLGQLYTAGYPLDWQRIWPEGAVRVPLPKHPWKRKPYWRETDPERKERLESHRHPLLGRRINAAHPLFQARLDKRVIHYLQDHRVQGQTIFPGSAYVEMALAVGRELFGERTLTLEEIQFQKALFLSDSGEAPTIQFVCNLDDASYAIQSRTTQAEEEWILHAIGSLRASEQTGQSHMVDLQSLHSRLEELPIDEFYDMFHKAGLQYGPPFQGVKRLWNRDGEALAEVKLSEDCHAEAGQYQFHPALLDCCFQAIVGALPRDISGGTLYLPVYIEKVRFLNRPGDTVWAHVQLRQFNQNSMEADIGVYDREGRLLVRIGEFRCQAIEGQRGETPADWSYETRWHEKPLGNTSPGIDGSIPSLRELVDSVSAETVALDRYFDYSRVVDRAESNLNRVAAVYAWDALRRLNQACERQDEISVRSLLDQSHVLDRYEYLLRRFMILLEREEFVKNMSGDRWQASTEVLSRPPGEVWREALENHPAMLPELTLLNQVGGHLYEALRGEVDSLGLLFPGGSTDNAERFYEHSIAASFANIALRLAVQRVIECLPQGKNIRILEVGGGTGGMTAQILPLLKSTQAHYVFSDISNAFLLKAEQKFSNFPFVEFEVLDIEKDPISQGFSEQSFDIILASHVFHATRDLAQTLTHVAQLLKPGGLLMFLEIEHVPAYLDLIFGLLDGWWRFADFHIRPDYPLIDGNQWTRLLQSVAFDEIEYMPIHSTSGQAALFARKPASKGDLLGDDPDVSVGGGGWLVFADRAGVGEELGNMLSRGGGDVAFVVRGETFRELDQQRYEVNPSNPGEIEQLSRAAIDPSNFRGVVHLWSLDAATTEHVTLASLQDAERFGCHSLVHIVQALEKLGMGGVTRSLICVTRNAQPVGENVTALSIAQSPLIGLARVIFNEHLNMDCKLVDLGPATDPFTDANQLLRELNTDDADREVALRGDVRFVPRAQRFEEEFKPVQWSASETKAQFQLTIPKPGALDRLVITERESPELGPGEVEIEVMAAALNFRDVMKALFAFLADSPDATVPGDECAGRITRVGEDVADLQVGDEVIAAAPGSFASHVVVPEALVTKKPDHLSFAEAATMPVAFLTSYYALVYLARLRRGESVLIHSATGGVGLAALQVAQNIGAEVYATAGNAGKRHLLEQMGVQRVMNSRSLDFADEVIEETGGRGVDVVLNSLAGQAIAKGIRCLAPRGRFVELGKRDIYQNSKLGLWNFRKNLSYYAADLSQLFTDQEMMQLLLAQFHEMLRGETFRPLPHCVFPISRSTDAFRFMAQAKHVGKIVLSLPDPGLRIKPKRPPTTRLRSDGTYLVTGGFGGYGLTVAEWCIEHGAGCVVLMGRRGAASKEAREAMARLERRGGRVVEAKADVARPDEVKEVCGRIDQTMPPLRGVFHLAMVLDDSILLQLNPERFAKVTAPKAAGAWNLHEATLDCDLDFFVTFSSISSLFGNPGQANYAAANSFLDAIAHWRRACGLPATTINWGALEGVGYLARHGLKSDFLTRVNRGFTPDETMAALDRILLDNPTQLAVCRINWSALQEMAPRNAAYFSALISESQEASPRDDASASVRESIDSAAEEQKKTVLETYVRGQLARVLGTTPDKLDAHRPLNEVGLDSLMGVELKNRLEKDLAVSLPVGDLIQNPTLTKLVTSLAARLGFDAQDAKPSTNGREPANATLVPLREGQGTEPLFCFPPLGGELGIYRQLAERLGPDHTMLGVQSPADDANAKKQTLEEMAALYAGAIRARQPEGPYHLLGFSAAGYFAMATAHALETQGAKVRFVALLESDIRWTDPELPRKEIFKSLLAEVEGLLAQRESRPPALADSNDPSELVDRLLSASEEKRIEIMASWLRGQVGEDLGNGGDELRSFASAVHAQLRMLEKARLSMVQAPLLIWRARETLLGGFESEANWASYTKTGTIDHTVDGGHYALMVMPGVAEVADRLNSIWSDWENGGGKVGPSVTQNSEESHVV